MNDQEMLERSVFRVIGIDGKTHGTGFVVAERLAVTCAHVIGFAGAKKGDDLRICFFNSRIHMTAEVLSLGWSDKNRTDVAFLRLYNMPKGVLPVRLASAKGSKGHIARTLGYPDLTGQEGVATPWEDKIYGLTNNRPYPRLTLQSNLIQEGYSGAPVLDTEIDKVVGMIHFGWNQQRVVVVQAITADAIHSLWPTLNCEGISDYKRGNGSEGSVVQYIDKTNIHLNTTLLDPIYELRIQAREWKLLHQELQEISFNVIVVQGMIGQSDLLLFEELWLQFWRGKVCTFCSFNSFNRSGVYFEFHEDLEKNWKDTINNLIEELDLIYERCGTKDKFIYEVENVKKAFNKLNRELAKVLTYLDHRLQSTISNLEVEIEKARRNISIYSFEEKAYE